MRDGFAARVVVVTGASSGIGRSIALCFAREGARVALLDVDADGLARVAEQAAALGAETLTERCDVTDRDACRRAIDAVCAAWGGVDVLVNNAGISHHSRVTETTPEVIRRVMDVNFFGAVHCTSAALPSLVERRGAIAVISSVAGFAPLVGRAGYAASKHALHGYFDTLRAELRPDGVEVLVVCPAYADTAIDRHAIGANGAATRKRTVGKLLSPDDVAEAVVAGLGRRRDQVALSWVAKSSFWLWTLAPTVYERLMRRTS
jgi:NAD(P)-dependent dehydrogenase (short-subunit alcohol dehydrogenase family)